MHGSHRRATHPLINGKTQADQLMNGAAKEYGHSACADEPPQLSTIEQHVSKLRTWKKSSSEMVWWEIHLAAAASCGELTARAGRRCAGPTSEKLVAALLVFLRLGGEKDNCGDGSVFLQGEKGKEEREKSREREKEEREGEKRKSYLKNRPPQGEVVQERGQKKKSFPSGN